MNLYLNLVGLFILGAVLLLGSLIVSLFWKILADRHGDPRVVAFAQRTLAFTELLFTLPGTAILIGTAAAITLLNNIDFNTLWVQTAAGIFGLALLVWLAVLVPLQIKQSRAARVFASGGAIPDSYWKTCRLWNKIRLLDILLVAGTLAAVIFKPV